MNHHDWRVCESKCEHCGETLLFRPAVVKNGITIAGCEPMEYVHANGGATCVLERKARPYSDWGKFTEYLTAKEAPVMPSETHRLLRAAEQLRVVRTMVDDAEIRDAISEALALIGSKLSECAVSRAESEE